METDNPIRLMLEIEDSIRAAKEYIHLAGLETESLLTWQLLKASKPEIAEAARLKFIERQKQVDGAYERLKPYL